MEGHHSSCKSGHDVQGNTEIAKENKVYSNLLFLCSISLSLGKNDPLKFIQVDLVLLHQGRENKFVSVSFFTLNTLLHQETRNNETK